MKRLLIMLALALFLVSTSGCLFLEPRLEINNKTEAMLTDVSWNEYDYGTLAEGQSRSMSVVSGQGYIYLSFGGKNYRTEDTVYVTLGKTTFTIDMNTFVNGLEPLAKDSSSIRIKDILGNAGER